MRLPTYIQTGDGAIVFAGIEGDTAVWTQDVSRDRIDHTPIGPRVTHMHAFNTWRVDVATFVRAIRGLLIDMTNDEREALGLPRRTR